MEKCRDRLELDAGSDGEHRIAPVARDVVQGGFLRISRHRRNAAARPHRLGAFTFGSRCATPTPMPVLSEPFWPKSLPPLVADTNGAVAELVADDRMHIGRSLPIHLWWVARGPRY